PQDKEFADFIKKNKLNYILVANKCSSKRDRQQADEFYELGLGEPIKIAAINGVGVGDMLDIAVDKFPKKLSSSTQSTQSDQVVPQKENIKICFIGKTNVGKSSILNSILNEEKVIVSEAEHTTRDAQFIPFTYKDYQFTLIDTAGVRKKRTQIKKNELEFKSVQQTEKAIKKSDIAILVTDVSKNLSVGDLKFSRYIKNSQKGLIIVANKWDLIDDKDLKTYAEYVKYYYITMPFFRWAKIIPTSAKEKIRVLKILDEAVEIYHKSNLEIGPEELVNFKNKIIKIHPPTIGRGNRKPKIYQIKQVGMNPQTFEVIIGKKTSLNESYLKFIEKKLRSEYNLDGVAVIAYVRKLQNTM
ncbi:GTP-binding protein, partial [bacterium]|nr:GTP-binding protein [bacterium]